MKIVVTAGHDHSLGTIALLEKLESDGHEIAEVLVVKTVQLNRLYSYLKQFGLMTVIAKFQTHYLQKGHSYLDQESQFIKALLEKNKIAERSVRKFCVRHSIAVTTVRSLSTRFAIERCTSVEPDVIVYFGGGILSPAFIRTASKGVLNAHSGPLPAIRGMNAIEWSLLKGFSPTTSIHLIDSGIDTGSILFSERLPMNPEDSIYSLRGRALVHNVELLSKVLKSFDGYLKKAISQEASDGLQYFVMHRKMKALVVNKRMTG